MMRRLLCLLLTVLLVCPAALADDFGVLYDDFIASYAENITALNQSAGRMLLPHSPTRDYDAKAQRYYRINSGSLAAEIHLDDSGKVISTCQIVLTAPEGMKYGDAAYTNFTVSALHCYALIMAMDDAPTAYERYALVQRLESALSQAESCEDAAGDYRITCTRSGQSATFLFENDLLLPSAPIVPDEGEDAEADEEEGALIG